VGRIETEVDQEKSYQDPLSEISIYFNAKNEVTFIDPGYDTIYYNNMKDKIPFSEVFVEHLGKPLHFDRE
jgi:hypothetical protein